MKVKLLSAVIAASFLAGCSSSGSSDSPSEPAGVASVQTFEGEHFDGMAIQGDSGEYNTVAIRGVEGNTVFNVGGELYFTDGDVVKDASGNVVGNIEVRNNELVFVNDNGFVHLSVEDGRLIVEEVKLNPVHPIEPTPEHPIEWEPANPIEPVPEHPIAGGPVNPIEPVPEHPIEGGPVNPIEPAPEHPIEGGPVNPIEPVPEHPIAAGPVNPIEPVPEHPMITNPSNPIEGAASLPVHELTQEQRAELKQKVQSLSQEQRQQIKRAIRDRAERS
ncbi:zona pellucida protein alpha [Vibrio rotiferianus]|uniref:zona pellucida protein alpha n=1 Tax=Vibrio rotiferianus TaxID=190895 RepID=UPI00148C08F8|nr:zona pellucida protein alpha [Vibrio rotiferianus]NOH66522.1 zona pellucida protein alpha [Vibrio rotiferianus]